MTEKELVQMYNYKTLYTKLKKENAELKRHIKADCIDCADYIKNKSLEKENAELKTNYKVLSCSVGDFGELQDKLEEEQRKNNGLSDNLTKAKEMLQTVFDKWKEERWILQSEKEVKQIENLMKQAEQFLKEVEK